MADDFFGGGAAALQHVFHEIDTATRRIEFVAQKHEGWTGCGAEAAVHAGAQHLVAGGEVRILQPFIRELSLHNYPEAKQTKVFWFFFSKKNILSFLLPPKGGLKPTLRGAR
jgi:hypothetical protein